MAVTYRVGAQTSIHSPAANQMPDIDRMLYLEEPIQTPLFQMLYLNEKLPASPVINENAKFSWFEDKYVPSYTVLTATVSGGASADNISGTDVTWINEGDVLWNQATDDLVYVDSIASGEVDITDLAGSTFGNMAVGDYIFKVGSRNHEMATARTAVSTVETEVSNYCEIHSETVTQSGRKQAGENYTDGKSYDDEVRKKMVELKEEVERNFWFSSGSGTVTVSTDYRHTYNKGLKGFISTNAVSYSGSPTEAALDDFLYQSFLKGKKDKDFVMGGELLKSVGALIKNKYEVTNLTTKYGINISQYQTNFGLASLIWNPNFVGPEASNGYLVDRTNLRMRYMANDKKGSRKFRIEEGVETPGTDGLSTKLLMDVGIEVPLESAHGLFYKV